MITAPIPLTAAQRAEAFAMNENRGPDSLEAHLVDLLDEYGLFGYHTRNSIGSAKGWPDWAILGPRGAVFRELKTETGKLTVDQRRVGGKLICAGLDWSTWRPRDLLDGTIARQLAAIAVLQEAS